MSPSQNAPTKNLPLSDWLVQHCFVTDYIENIFLANDDYINSSDNDLEVRLRGGGQRNLVLQGTR